MDLDRIEQIGNDKSVLSNNARTVDPDAIPRYNGGFIPANPEEFAAQKPYDAKEAMKAMNENIAAKRANTSRVPDAIKNAIMTNPLMLEDAGYTTDIDNFTENLGKKLNGLNGIQRAMGILEQSENMDKTKQVERMITERSDTKQNVSGSGGVDYEIIKAIVENVIDRKLAQFKQTLNENASHNKNGGSLSVMKLADKFLFLDSDDNIYECVMKYKGKNKKRK